MDRVIEVAGGERGIFEMSLSADHPILQAHFPGRPMVPGVIVIEALAQAAGCVWQAGQEAPIGAAMLVSVKGARFRAPVGPGDVVVLDVTCTHQLGPMRRFRGTARVGDRVVAEAELTLARPRG